MAKPSNIRQNEFLKSHPVHARPSRIVRNSLTVSLLICCGCSSPVEPQQDTRSAMKPPSSNFPLRAEPSVLLLGMLKPGDSSEASARIRNTSQVPHSVDRIVTSCPCVSSSASTFSLGSGEDCVITLKFDSREEPEFRGNLTVEVMGKSRDDELLFQLLVRVRIHEGG